MTARAATLDKENILEGCSLFPLFFFKVTLFHLNPFFLVESFSLYELNKALLQQKNQPQRSADQPPPADQDNIPSNKMRFQFAHIMMLELHF